MDDLVEAEEIVRLAARAKTLAAPVETSEPLVSVFQRAKIPSSERIPSFTDEGVWPSGNLAVLLASTMLKSSISAIVRALLGCSHEKARNARAVK